MSLKLLSETTPPETTLPETTSHANSSIKPYGTAVGRRIGRPLSSRRKALIERELPKYAICLEQPFLDQFAFKCSSQQEKTPESCSEFCLEVGFGGGEHLAEMARREPSKRFIGCEYYLSGVASLLSHISEQGLENIRIHSGHAQEVLEVLGNGSLERCAVLFPDPWPKARHVKRRFLQTDTLDRLALLLRSGGELRLASDHPMMISWMDELLSGHKDFELLKGPSREALGLTESDWPQTRYELKALRSGLSPTYFRAIKKDVLKVSSA